MSPKEPFANAVAKQGALWRLLSVLERPDPIEAQTTAESSGTEDREIIRRKVKGWSLLESLSSSPSVATKMIESSCWLELLGILVGHAKFSRMWAARLGAAKTLSRLMWDPQTGPSTGMTLRGPCDCLPVSDRPKISLCYLPLFVAPLLQRFLPSTLVVLLKEEGPDVMLKLFDGESDTPELIWNSSMRAELRTVLSEQLDECLASRTETGEGGFLLPAGVFVKYKSLADELFIGGVYLSRFLKEPTYNLRDPTTFLEMLMQRWTHEIQIYFRQEPLCEEKESTSTALVDASQDTLQLVTSACVYLCKVRDSLCDKLAQWGYMERCLTFLDEILDRQLFGSPLLSVMRVLHVAANRISNVESLCVSGRSDGKNTVVDYTIKSIRSDPDSLHPDTAFMAEMLKKVFTVALGDVKKAPKTMNGSVTATYGAMHAMAMAPSPAPGNQAVSRLASKRTDDEFFRFIAYATAPSPAPGEGFVQRGRVEAGDDPLAMFGGGALGTQQQYSTGGGSHGHVQQMGFSGVYGQQPVPFSSVQGMQSSFMNPSQIQQGGIGGQSLRQQSSFGPSLSHTNIGGQSMAGQNMQVSSMGFQPPGNAGNASPGASYQSNASLSSSGMLRGLDAYGRPQAPHGMSSSVPSIRQPGLLQQALAYGTQQAVAISTGGRATPGQQQHPSLPDASQQHIMDYTQQYHQGQPQQPQNLTANMQPVTQPTNQVRYNPQMPQPRTQLHGQRQAAYQQEQQQGHGMMQQQPQQQHHSHAQMMPQQQQGRVYQQQQSVMQQPQRQQVPMTQQQQPGISYQQQQGMMNQQQQMPQDVMQQQALPQGLVRQQPQSMQQLTTQSQQHATIQSQQLSQMQQQQLLQFPPQQPMQGQSFMLPQAQQGQFDVPQMQQAPQFQVETVADDTTGSRPIIAAPEPQQQPQYRPTAMEGSGIDARAKPDPKVEAEQQAVCVSGAPGAAHGRVALLQSALVNDLPKFLLDSVLENPCLTSVKDPAAAKVHTVDLLKLLTEDPGYGMKFQLILDEIPAWKKYKSQDHSLFITGSEQKQDYFLTDGRSGEPAKLLTQG
jgi:hypothetical protein